jgi:glycosyltransferase involved in cell wall biosynthesis
MAAPDQIDGFAVARPRFSVVIPTYRRADFLREAVASVLAQRRPADQIIVVSDGSDSEAAGVAERAGVHFIEIEHGGVARARNAGIEAATADWVCFLDDDDLYHPDYLAELDAYVAAHPAAEAVNTQYWKFSATPADQADLIGADLDTLVESSRVVQPVSDMTYLNIEGRSYDLLLGGLRGNLSSSAVRRARLIQAGGFPAGAICAEDWTMFVNVARYVEWHVIERRLVFMRMHAGNNTHQRAVLNGIHTLRAFGEVWQDVSRPTPPHRPVNAYRIDYRFMLRAGLDSARRARDWAAYRKMLVAARPLLPRRIDRVRAMVPPSLHQRFRP